MDVSILISALAFGMMLSANAAFGADLSCSVIRPKNEPLHFYVTQIDLKNATAQLTVGGGKPVRTLAQKHGNVLTLYAHGSVPEIEFDYLVTVSMGNKKPFDVIYTLHSVSSVKELDLVMTIPAQFKGTCTIAGDLAPLK